MPTGMTEETLFLLGWEWNVSTILTSSLFQRSQSDFELEKKIFILKIKYGFLNCECL